MQPKIIVSPIQVVNKLADMGLSDNGVLDVIRAMILARRGCTENDAPSTPGFKAWADGVRRIREILIPLGWEKDETNQISSVSHAQRGLRIAVMNTDQGTGIESSGPQPCTKKGSGTQMAIHANSFFFEFLPEVLKEMEGKDIKSSKSDTKRMVQWYLCVYCDEDTYRAELSCPVQMTQSGEAFDGFLERIIIVGDDSHHNEPSVRVKNPDGPTEYEITVNRKNAS